MENLSTRKNTSIKLLIESLVIIVFAMIPLVFPEMPYRVNIYLSWEGAFRLYEGQLPYRDFGLPMGFIYWVVPAVFFKIFGPYLITLIKAQVFINTVAAFAFRDILKSFKLGFGERVLSLIIFGISYVMFNYWPWYNHSVIVYEIIAFSFILRFAFSKNTKSQLFYLLLGSLFAFICFFTKQDGGGMGFMICLIIVVYVSIIEKKILFPIYYVGAFSFLLILTILLFKGFDFGYWFNYGQPPHYSRVSVADILEDFLAKSFWEKFYLSLMIIILLTHLKDLKSFFKNKQDFLFALFSFAVLGEALVFQVTSYVPANGHIFFHSFCFAYIIHFFGKKLEVSKTTNLIIYSFLLLLWWSSPHWRLVQPFYAKITPFEKKENAQIVSKNSYIKKEEKEINNQPWVSTPEWDAFKGMKMPKGTKQGIIDLLNLDIVKEKGEDLKVLNMSELTPLAHTIGYKMPKNSRQPLWYHQGVGLFDREIEYLCEKIENNAFDIVLFEEIPQLNNFYPPKVQQCLKKNYKLINRFEAPRRNEPGSIEVYLKIN